MSDLTFNKPNEELIINVTEAGVFIIYGWTVAISKDVFTQYMNNYNSIDSIDGGFYEFPEMLDDYFGKVVLTHNGAKMTLTTSETQQIIEYVKSKL